MKFKIGDVVRFRFAPEISAVVSGYAKGRFFKYPFVFGYDEDVVLATNEHGSVHVFSQDNSDWEVVDHADMTECLTKIVKAKEKDA